MPHHQETNRSMIFSASYLWGRNLTEVAAKPSTYELEYHMMGRLVIKMK